MSVLTDLDQKSPIEKSLVRWLFDFADFGILVTDVDLKVVYVNKWFRRNVGGGANALLDRCVFEVFPELKTRGFDRYYDDALTGQTRILSHRFHGYLFPMEPHTPGTKSAKMPQSARISPLLSESTVIGTISVVEDVSERVVREMELSFQIDERNRLLQREISAREIAEENERLKDTFDALKTQGAHLLELGKERDTLMHRVIAGQEEERRRIARNIHDHLGQQLTALRFALSWVQQESLEDPEISKTIARAQAIAEKLDDEVDYLSRELRPAAIDDIGFEGALRTLVREWSEHYGIDAQLYSTGLAGQRFEEDTEINLYRIVQEGLTNISKHAQADKVVVLLEKRDDQVVLIVEDNGVGFDVAAKAKLNANDRGMGIFGMRERAALVGGTMEIESETSVGTSVFVRIPVDENR